MTFNVTFNGTIKQWDQSILWLSNFICISCFVLPYRLELLVTDVSAFRKNLVWCNDYL